MLARDLVRPFPTVGLETDALEAASLLAERRLPGLIVLDERGFPHTVLAGTQVLRLVVPAFVQDDPALARAYDEKSADELCAKLAGRTVRDMLPKKGDRAEIRVVPGDATSIEIAAQMAGMRSPIVAVVDGGEFVGAITVSGLLAHLVSRGTAR